MRRHRPARTAWMVTAMAVLAIASVAVPGTASAAGTATAAAGGAATTAAARTAQAGDDGPLAPANLRVDGQAPAALAGQPQPVLSWTVNDSRRAEAQTAYQVRVRDPRGGPVWDSGQVSSGNSVDVSYGGPPLASDHSYEWTVRTWDREGTPSPWSAAAQFDVGLLAPADWSAWWLQLADGALVRGDFNLVKPVARARLYFAAQGIAEPYLNGSRVAPSEVLDSSVTDYSSRVLYRDLDVTSQLRTGPNAVAFMMGKGQYSGSPTLVAQLDVSYADGSTATFGTGPAWRTTAGPVTGDDFYYGETYDARKAVAGWDTAGSVDSGWTAAHAIAPAANQQPQLQADPTPPTNVVATIAPVRETEPAAGTRVFDFGQNYTGQVTIRAAAPSGTTAAVKKGEILDSTGQVSTANISFSPADPPRQTDHYTFAGTGTETYTPHFNYAGFRYAQVTGLPDATPVTVTAEVIHTDVPATGRFSTSNPLLNQIQGAVAQTQLNDLETMPMDCPTREKHGWLGDAGDSDQEAMANYDMQSLYGKWLGDIVTSLNPDGSIPSVAPAEGNNAAYFTDPAWATAYPQVIWDSYAQYGDTGLIRANYPHVKAWVDYLATISDSDHIVVHAPGSWGDDWLATVSTPHDYFQTGFYYLDATLLSKMAAVLGDTTDASHYAAIAADIAAGFNRRYFDAGTDTYGTGTQLSYAMPLVLGIVPAGHEQAVLGKLIAGIAAHGDHLTTGFVGSTFVFQALGRYHRNDVALAIAERTDYPSFGYMVANGPGTIWEKWANSPAADGTSSKDHIGLGGSIGQWFYQQLAGIQPGTAAYRTFTLAPSVAGDLTHASASQQTVRGLIESSWQRDGSTLTYHARVPVGSTATIELPLPGGPQSTVSEGGQTIFAAGRPAGTDTGLKVGSASGGTLTLTAGSGDYTFTVSPPNSPFTELAVSAGSPVTIAPGSQGNISAVIEGHSTGGSPATIGVQAPPGWTGTASPAQVPLTPASTATLDTVSVAVPAGTTAGTYPVTVTARAPDGTAASSTVQVTVYRTVTLYDFESGTQGWQPGANVNGVAAVTSFANGPGHPHSGQYALEAAGAAVGASQWRTVSVAPAQPLDLSSATRLSVWIDGYGGAPGATGYQAQVVLHSGASSLPVTVPISNDSWNQVVVNLSGWAGRGSITSIDASFSAVGSTVAWSGRFQLDDIAWTDQAS